MSGDREACDLCGSTVPCVCDLPEAYEIPEVAIESGIGTGEEGGDHE